MTGRMFPTFEAWLNALVSQKCFRNLLRRPPAGAICGLLAVSMTGVAPAGGIGNLVFRDENGNRFFDVGDVTVPGVPLQLFVTGTEPGADQQVAITVSDAAGHCLFGGLADGTYYVFIPDAAFKSGGALLNTRSLPGTPGADGTDDDVGENGIDSTSPMLSGVRSGPVVLRAGMAPVSSATETGNNNESDDAADDQTDLTVDFGFERFTTRVGDFVLAGRQLEWPAGRGRARAAGSAGATVYGPGRFCGRSHQCGGGILQFSGADTGFVLSWVSTHRIPLEIKACRAGPNR